MNKNAKSPVRYMRFEDSDVMPEVFSEGNNSTAKPNSRVHTGQGASIAVRTVELTKPLVDLSDVSAYSAIRLFPLWDSSPVGKLDITNKFENLSADRLKEHLIAWLEPNLLHSRSDPNRAAFWSQIKNALDDSNAHHATERAPRLSDDILVSIVIPTCGRPDDLRRCLSSLKGQNSTRKLEIIVVDNRPGTNVTPPVVNEFSGVKLVEERRKGISYARNAGIAFSSGEIIAFTDDDVTAPPDWIENLVAPYAKPDVMAVTGNILPEEMETESQRLFEEYGAGGLGRGFTRWEADKAWFDDHKFESVRTWMLGAGANASFRSSIFRDQRVGLMSEVLGTGTPTGSGEDLYHFYRTLKVGGKIVYEPRSFVWHHHRGDMDSFHHQLFNYSKGIVAYHLLTLLNDGDRRALSAVLVHLWLWHTKRIWQRLTGRSTFPLNLNLIEISGHLAAPWGLWQSFSEVKRQGRSSINSQSVAEPTGLARTAKP